MPIAVGQRFVRRQNAARSSTANGTAADVSYDTAVISEGGYSYTGPQVSVDTAGLYLNLFDLGLCDLASTRACGTLVPSVNAVQQAVFRATHRYLRNSGGAQDGCSFGAAILNLSASDNVRARNPGALTPTDAVNNYATGAGEGGGLQLIRLPDGNFTDVRRTVDAAEVGTSNINTTRPWLNSSGTWSTITFNSQVQDDDNLFSTGGDITLAANTKYLIVWGATCYSTDASRHTYVSRLRIGGVNYQYASAYQRNTASQGPPMLGLYLHETGGTTETLNIQATHETEGGDAGTPNVSDAFVQVLELPASAEWIHADNGATDSLTTALAGTTTWYDTPLSSTFRADGNSDLSLDAANDAIQNDSGGTLPVLMIGWQGWDRDSGASGTRKAPMLRGNNGGSAIQYANNSAFSRGQQSSDDTWQARMVTAMTFDLANTADCQLQVTDRASGSNADMGIYASTNRHFLGVQVLNLNTLDAGGTTYDESISEPVDFSDTQAPTVTALDDSTEAIELAEQLTEILAAGDDVTESVELTEAQAGGVSAFDQLTEGLELTDTQEGINAISVAVAETVELADAHAAIGAIAGVLAGTLDLGEDTEDTAQLAEVLAESVTLEVTLAGGTQVAATLSEGIDLEAVTASFQSVQAAMLAGVDLSDTHTVLLAGVVSQLEPLELGEDAQAAGQKAEALSAPLELSGTQSGGLRIDEGLAGDVALADLQAAVSQVYEALTGDQLELTMTGTTTLQAFGAIHNPISFGDSLSSVIAGVVARTARLLVAGRERAIIAQTRRAVLTKPRK